MLTVPVASNRPAAAAVDAMVLGVPWSTIPKLRSWPAAIVMGWRTVAVALIDPLVCAAGAVVRLKPASNAADTFPDKRRVSCSLVGGRGSFVGALGGCRARVRRAAAVLGSAVLVSLAVGSRAAAQAAGVVAVRVTVVRPEAGQDELAAARQMADSTVADSTAGRQIHVGVATIRTTGVRPLPRSAAADRPRRVVLIHFLN